MVVVCWEQSRAERAGRQAASRFGRKVGIEEDWGYSGPLDEFKLETVKATVWTRLYRCKNTTLPSIATL